MDLLNEINGIVERNQWICSLKLAVLLRETDEMTGEERQFTGFRSLSFACGIT
jgi:hypothetical protein